MSRKTAQPWWADVQHLRPRTEREADETAQQQRLEGARRFARGTTESPRRSPHRTSADPRDRASERQERALDAVVFADTVTPQPQPQPQPEAPRQPEPAPQPAELVEIVGPHSFDAPARVDDWLKPRHADARIENGRKTIEIRGQVDRVVGITVTEDVGDTSRRGRRRRRSADRIGPRPDRIAMWAVLLGIVLILVAAFSDSEAAQGAVLALDAGVAASGR